MTETYEQKVEKVARAICEGRMWVGAFETLNNEQRYSWRRDARAALAALGITDTAPAPAKPSDEELAARFTEFFDLADTPAQAYALGYRHGSTAPAPAISGGEMVSVPQPIFDKMMEALSQIGKMYIVPDDKMNRMTLIAAVEIARRSKPMQIYGSAALAAADRSAR